MNARSARLVILMLALLVPVLAANAGEMASFQLVLFKDGVPEIELSDHRAQRMTTSHNHWMENLIQDEVTLVSGPVESAAPLRHVAIFDAGSSGDVYRMLENNAAVRLRMFDLEVYSLWAESGILRKPERNAKRTTALLGLLKRPSDAPEFTEEELAEIQAGHLENIRAMADSGDLVIAGPVDGGDELRGILIFRTRAESEVRKLVERDPAIQKRRLELELYRWTIPRGTIPHKADQLAGRD